MKQKVSTILCIALLALQLNSLVAAEEDRTVSSGDIESAILNGDIVIAEGTLEQETSVSSGDSAVVGQEETVAPDVSGGDAVPGGADDGETVAPDVSGGDAVPDAADEEDVPDATDSFEEMSGDEQDQDASDGSETDLGEPEVGETSLDVSDGDALNPSVSGGDLPAQNVSDGDAAEKVQEPIDLNKLAVVRMQVPRSLDFVIDPCEICGQGTVWSRDYAFCNNGDTPVLIKMSSIKCIVREGVSCVGSEVSEETVLAAATKTIKLQLRMSNGDVVYITQEGSAYEAIVNPGEAFSLAVSGAANIPDSDWWKNGDVSIAMTYRAEICDD